MIPTTDILQQTSEFNESNLSVAKPYTFIFFPILERVHSKLIFCFLKAIRSKKNIKAINKQKMVTFINPLDWAAGCFWHCCYGNRHCGV